MRLLRCRLAVLGESAVGKTALIQMFKSEGAHYPKNYIMTLAAEFHSKTVQIREKDTSVEFYVMDLSGKGLYDSLRRQVLEGTSMFIVVYDVTNEESFKMAEKWIDEYNAVVSNSVGGALIGNKSDLEERIEVKTQRGQDLAREHNLAFFECSALRGTEVETPFNWLANAFLNAYEDKMKLYASLDKS
ncbi:hypothetical protein PROFUN_09301 [Planoprotostelium fungivorum]|uniref:Uncharacterized protein n=1 Tax=Planoprotostelium fungivorum TaxID=1890364 RepID=A0A2P6NH82_9EUKA|nr:hypothetical protein PROFUN_09301 [Planoprotostelium fungivorum]